MSDRLSQLKEIYMSQRDSSREYLFYPTQGRGYKNDKLSPKTVNGRLKSALAKTDIPVERQRQLSAHKLRATLITWIIKNNGIEAARQAARHSSVNTTQIYNNATNLGIEAMKNVHYR
jgi:integrase